MKSNMIYMAKFKKYKILLIALICPLAIFGQASTGIKIGANFYNLTGSTKSHYLQGYAIGVYSKADLEKNFSFLVELDYSIKKSEVINPIQSNLELNFVNARFGAAYNFSERWYTGLTPYFSYMIKAKQNPILINKDFYTHFAVGINPLIGFETRRVSFMLKYDLGLTVLTLESTPEAKDNALKGAKFNGWEFDVGVKF